MTQVQHNSIVTVLHPVCCGLDVHKKSISACLIVVNAGAQEEMLLEVFGTLTDELTRLREWLIEHECPIVALESTGVYWRPVHNILEGYLTVVLVNARHIKNVPGRKTDMVDCQWIAALLRVGFLRGSFIPSKEVRQWRDLTRYRKKLVHALGDVKRQTHKMLETSNIKISSVVSDLFGKTCRHLMNLLAQDETPLTLKAVESCLRGKLRSKGAELFRAVEGFFEAHHRWMLREFLERVEELEERIRRVQARLTSLFPAHEEVIERIDAVPGINVVAAHAILAETGTTLDCFPNAGAFCSWAGVCPGNNESAGKRHSTRSPVRKGHLKTLMVEAAWAAVKTKGSYYRAKYFSIRARLGAKKAILAIAHRLLKALFHIIKYGAHFKDLGEDYVTNIRKQSKIKYLVRQAEKLGFKVVPAAL